MLVNIKEGFHSFGRSIYNNSDKILTGINIAGAIGAVGFSIYTTAKKLPSLKEEYQASLQELDDIYGENVDKAQKALDSVGEETIKNLFDPSSDGEEGVEEDRNYIRNLQTVVQNGTTLYAHENLKVKAKYVGKLILAYLPAALCLIGSVTAAIFNYRIGAAKLLAAGATITGLTAELASTREQVKTAIGEEEFKKEEIKALKASSEDEEALKKRLYSRLYSDHLKGAMKTEDAIRIAEQQLLNTERLCNRKLNRARDGKLYFGDVLRALDFDTDECGQNTGWVVNRAEGDADDYDGYVDFGCWLENPDTGIKTLNPMNITEDGEILLDFNVEGKITDVYSFRRSGLFAR